MEIQKQGVIDQVNESLKQGRKLKEILYVMGIKSSTYYLWKNEIGKKDFTDEKSVLQASDRITTRSLTDEEVALILKAKGDYPQMRHRQIQGMLQKQDQYFSASSVFKVLKSNNLVEKYERRPSPTLG